MGRKRKYAKSYVISMRITDEELEDINHIMRHHQIARVSDLLRHAIEMIREHQPAAFAGKIDGQDRNQLVQTYA